MSLISTGSISLDSAFKRPWYVQDSNEEHTTVLTFLIQIVVESFSRRNHKEKTSKKSECIRA